MFFAPNLNSQLNILCVLDSFTETALSFEPNINLVFKKPILSRLTRNKIDLLLVESTWLGKNNSWQYQIASYPDKPERNNNKLKKLVEWAKSENIPTIFWNKEDPFHFDQFIDSARLFDYVFTTDICTIDKYKINLDHQRIYTLGFPFQPKIHYPTSLEKIKYKSSLFIGSYNQNMHDERRKWQDLCFSSAAPHGLTIVDRHFSDQKKYLQFPKLENTIYLPSLDYSQTGSFYRDYQQAINVNTIINSPTMFSRRLLEIMACGRLMVSNPSLAIDSLFSDFCEVINSEDDAKELFEQLSFGYTPRQIEMIQHASDHVFQTYTVKKWIQNILKTCNIDHAYLNT